MSGRGTAVASFVALAIAVGAASVDAAAAPDSGIRGQVLYGPTCPVVRPGETCVRPYRATLRIRRRATNRLVATVHSGKDGRFAVQLVPGRYVIHPVSGNPFPQASPMPVRVRRNEFTRVTIEFDSGIR